MAAAYSASKAAVIALTKALALEYAPHGITVNDIPPSSNDLTTFSATRSRNEYRRGTPGRPPVCWTEGLTSPIWSQYLSWRAVQPVKREA